MDWDIEVEEAFGDDEPPPNEVLGAALMVGMLDAVVELLAVEEVVEQLFAAVALKGSLLLQVREAGR